jgi:hypothetical protein
MTARMTKLRLLLHLPNKIKKLNCVFNCALKLDQTLITWLTLKPTSNPNPKPNLSDPLRAWGFAPPLCPCSSSSSSATILQFSS